MENKKTVDLNLTGQEFVRIANNFYNSSSLVSDLNRINVDLNLFNYIIAHSQDSKKKFKIAFVWIVLNPPYWQFAKQMIDGARNCFLPGHDVDYILWSDMPETKELAKEKIMAHVLSIVPSVLSDTKAMGDIDKISEDIENIRKLPNTTVFPLEAIEWPMPTLLRYHTFLQQEELLKTYDYIFYSDVDMAWANIVGDEILGQGLTSTCNPMYYLDSTMYPPYEPDSESTAYIPRPGRIIDDPSSSAGKRFQPLYFAGGFQGGRADKFIEAMKVMKKNIDIDLKHNKIAIWNDESHWNRYLFDNPPSVVLDPSYLYPDSLIKEYYEPRWGRSYQPKLITLTKQFSLRKLSPEEQRKLTMLQGK